MIVKITGLIINGTHEYRKGEDNSYINNSIIESIGTFEDLNECLVKMVNSDTSYIVKGTLESLTDQLIIK